MPFQSAPDCAEAVIRATYAGRTINNVLNFKRSGGYDVTSLTALAVAISTRCGSGYRPLMNPGVAYDSTLVRGLANINDIEVSDNTGAGVGTNGPTTLPANVSFVITLRSGLTGRSARGRFYMMPLSAENLTDIDTVGVIYAAAARTLLQNLKTDAATAGWQMVILSRRTLKALRPLAVAFPVTTIEYRNRTTDSQRGRLPKGH